MGDTQSKGPKCVCVHGELAPGWPSGMGNWPSGASSTRAQSPDAVTEPQRADADTRSGSAFEGFLAALASKRLTQEELDSRGEVEEPDSPIGEDDLRRRYSKSSHSSGAAAIKVAGAK